MTTTAQRYIEMKLDVPRAQSDAVCNFIIDNITNGIVLEEEDGATTVGIGFYVGADDPTDHKGALRDYLAQVLGPGSEVPFIREKLVAEVEWVEQYKQSVHPVVIGKDVVVRPTWHEAPFQTPYDIVIEPKMAFGTGTHETTRSCLIIIRNNFSTGMRFLDFGCGSGILSVLADKMGASYIKAIDYDVVAVENCVENFGINKVKAPNDVKFGSLEKAMGDPVYQFVCANIIKSTILPQLSNLRNLTADGGCLVLSGLLDQDETDVNAALAALNITAYDILRDEKWLTYTIRK